MPSFLDKLKKGMDIKEFPKEEIIKEELTEDNETLPEQPVEAVLTAKKETAPLEKEPKKKKEKGTKKISKTKKRISKSKAICACKSSVSVKERPAQKEEILEDQTDKKITLKVQEKKEPIPTSPISPGEQKTKPIENENWFELEGELTVDVYQTPEEIVIQSAVAGVKPGDLDITIENDIVTIKGFREKTVQEKEANYFHQECYWGGFSREIILPAEIDSARAKAVMKNGILTVRMPKIIRKKTKKLTVKMD